MNDKDHVEVQPSKMEFKGSPLDRWLRSSDMERNRWIRAPRSETELWQAWEWKTGLRQKPRVRAGALMVEDFAAAISLILDSEERRKGANPDPSVVR